MYFSSRLRQRLSRLRRDGEGPAPGSRVEAGVRAPIPEPFLPTVSRGAEDPWHALRSAPTFDAIDTPNGPVLRRRFELPLPADVPPIPAEFADGTAAFYDTETLGLGSPAIFLAGLAVVAGGAVTIEQWYAADYSREVALLARVRDRLTAHALLVTFNGRSYDLPVTRDRLVRFRLEPLGRVPDVDLLPLCRRKWRDTVPNCRLVTLERHVLGRRRIGDVPSWEIPSRYLDAVRTGDCRELDPVFHHNALDLVSMVELVPLVHDELVRVREEARARLERRRARAQRRALRRKGEPTAG